MYMFRNKKWELKLWNCDILCLRTNYQALLFMYYIWLRFEGLMWVHILVFWDVIFHSVVDGYNSFGGICYCSWLTRTYLTLQHAYRVPYLWTVLAEKRYRFCQRYNFLALHPSLAVHYLLAVQCIRRLKVNFIHSCNQIAPQKIMALMQIPKTHLHSSQMYF
jgi:hypothetical protein